MVALKNFLRDFGSIVLFLLVWVAFQTLDPFSSESATRRASQDFFASVAAPFYGMSFHPARDQIAVVEITDATLDTLHHAWPLAYGTLALYLDEILDAAPKAVFVDIEFAREQPGQTFQDFAEVLDKADAKHIPILFAGGGIDDRLPEPLTNRATVMRWQGDPGFYPLAVEGPGHAGKPIRNVAAFDLYTRLCKAGALERCELIAADDVLDHPMLVRWGAAMPPEQPLGSDTRTCRDFAPASFGTLRYAAEVSVARLLPGLGYDTRQPCFYELTLGAEQLSGATTAGRPLEQLLTNRVVFLGADLVGGHDVMPSPPNGLVSGTQFHAMAFDYLLTYGNGFFRAPTAWRIWPHCEITQTTLFGALAWVVALLLLAAERRRARARLAWVTATIMTVAATVDLLQRWTDGSLRGAGLVLGLYVALTLATVLAWGRPPGGDEEAGRRPEGWLRWGRRQLVRLARPLTLVAAFATANDLLFRWPPSDWFGLVLLFFAIGETHRARAGKHEVRLVDGAIDAVHRLSKFKKENRHANDPADPRPDGAAGAGAILRADGRHLHRE